MLILGENGLSRPNKILQLLISMIPVFLVISSEPSANAIVPQIQNIVVYNSGSDTILNITINHIPAGDPGHYVNFTQVTFSGTVHNFTVPVQSAQTFTISCNVGVVQGTPTATVRANCTVNGWSSSHDIQIPEFSLPLLPLTLALSTSVAVFTIRRTMPRFRKLL
jgi:hypothetical protein